MNDQPPFDTVGDEPIEARIVSWVLGEASAFEAAELERLCEERPELLVFRRRMRALHGLLTEAEAAQPDDSWKLPAEKRKLLDEIFGEEKPVRLEADKDFQARRSGRRALLAIAACVMLAVVVMRLIPSSKYESEAVIEVKPMTVRKSNQDGRGFDMRANETIPMDMTPQFFGAEFEKIKSRNSLSKVVENLELTDRWGVDKETALRRLKGSISTENVPGTDLISIRVRQDNKEDARNITAEVARAYKAYRTDIESRNSEKNLHEFNKAVRDQEDKVEERRKVLATIAKTKGIIYNGQDSFYGSSGVNEDRGATSALETYNQLEKEKMQLSSQINSLLKYDSDQLITYASGLELPDNTIKSLYPQYQEKKQQLDSLKTEGLGDGHPTVKATKEQLEGMKHQMDEGVVNLRANLQAQLNMTSDRLRSVEAGKNQTREEAISRGLDAQDYVDAKRDFETDQQLLQQMKLKQVDAAIVNKVPPDSIEIHDDVQITDKKVGPIKSALEAVAKVFEGSSDNGAPIASKDQLAFQDGSKMEMPAKPASADLKPSSVPEAAAPPPPSSSAPEITASFDSGELALRETVRPDVAADTDAPGKMLGENALALPAAPASSSRARASGLADGPDESDRIVAGTALGVEGIISNGNRSGDSRITRNNIDALLKDSNEKADAFAADATEPEFESLAKGLKPTPSSQTATEITAGVLRAGVAGGGEMKNRIVNGSVAAADEDTDALSSLAEPSLAPAKTPSRVPGQAHGTGKDLAGKSDLGAASADDSLALDKLDATGKISGPASNTDLYFSDSDRNGAGVVDEAKSDSQAAADKDGPASVDRDEKLANLRKQLDEPAVSESNRLELFKEFKEMAQKDSNQPALRQPRPRVVGENSKLEMAESDEIRARLLSDVDTTWEMKVPKEAEAKKELADAAKPAAAVVTKAKAAPAKKSPLELMEEIAATEEPYSTFSLNINDAAFQIAKAALDKGEHPDPTAIKVEQFYNAVDYGDPAPASNEPVAATIEQSAHPIIPGRNLVRVALKTAAAGRGASQPLRLTLLVDQSGSMVREDRRTAMANALKQLSGLLTKNDHITVIGFSRESHLLADNLTGDQAKKLGDLVNQAASEGGTNLEQAFNLGEQMASRQHIAGEQNRIVLFTDGAANLGNANPERLAERVKSLRQKGIAFDIAGIGADGVNDRLLSELARNGNGRYYVVSDEKNDSFARQLAGAFRPAAENVKVQVHFNPDRVGRYKLIGFEKDRLKTEDFRNDAVDAAELAAEEAGVAVYQVETLPQGTGEIGEVSVRFRDTSKGEMVERAWTMPFESTTQPFDRAAPSMQLAGLSMLAAEKLKGGPLADAIDFNQLTGPRSLVKQFYGSSRRVTDMLHVIDLLK